MSGNSRAYAFEVSEYLFRLITASIRLYSNSTQQLGALGDLVEAHCQKGPVEIEQLGVDEVRGHLVTIPTKGPIKIALQLSTQAADILEQTRQRLSASLGPQMSLADALSVTLFDYFADEKVKELIAQT